jgi:hypothetical protein
MNGFVVRAQSYFRRLKSGTGFTIYVAASQQRTDLSELTWRFRFLFWTNRFIRFAIFRDRSF